MKLRLFAMLTSIGICLSAHVRAGCAGGDYYVESHITPEHHVTIEDLGDYAEGKIGVLPNSYWRVYHFLAYRALRERPISRQDVSDLGIFGWQLDIMRTRDDVMEAVNEWNGARLAVSGAKPVLVNPEANAGQYAYFTNCKGDAFRQASATLRDRLARGGQRWAASWLSRQDKVFANCGVISNGREIPPRMFPNDPVLPGPLELDAPTWLSHDRDYQMAAALFYAGRYDKAREAFLTISKDSHSSWQPMASYLAARSLVRKADLFTADEHEAIRTRSELLEQARKEMHTASQSYPAARGLATWLDARVKPQERVNELAAALASAKVKDGLARMLADYLRLMDNVDHQTMIASTQELTAWIGTMQATHTDSPYDVVDAKGLDELRLQAINTARIWYARKREKLWLLPILTNAHPGDLMKAEINAATAVSASDPAYQTLQYHLARIALENGRADDADNIVTAILKNSDMSIATRNRWLSLKMLSGKSIDDFLQAAQRRIAESGSERVGNGKKSDVAYEEDVAQHVFRDFPLSDLKAMRLRADFPEKWKRLLIEVIWTRAVIFKDYATADELIDEVVAKDRDSTSHLYNRYKSAATPDEKELAAVLILLNISILHPAVSDHTVPSWGCKNTYDSKRPNELLRVVPNAITKESRGRAEIEKKQLSAVPIRTRFLAPTIMAWAKQKTGDPEVPKSLHLLVAATRLECPYGDSDKGKSNHSREAFQLLHRLFPKSTWATKTRYYF